MDLATAKQLHPEAYDDCMRQIQEWADGLDQDPHPKPLDARVTLDRGIASLVVVVGSDFEHPIGFAAPLATSAAIH
jgi:hypothetical protein